MQDDSHVGTDIPIISIGGAAQDPPAFDWDVFHFQLNQTAAAFEERLNRAADDLLATRLQPGLGARLRDFDSAAQRLTSAGHAASAAHERLARDLRRLTWKSIVLAGTSGLLIIAGSAWIAFENVRIAREARLDAESSRVLRQVQIRSCGGKPCLRLDRSAPRWGANGEYILLSDQPR